MKLSENSQKTIGGMQLKEKRTEIHRLISSYLGRNKLVALLDESKVGVVICDRQLRYKALNQIVAEIHNEPVNAHLGRPLRKILGNFADQVIPLWETVLASGRPYTNLEVVGKLPKRSAIGRWVQNFFPLMDRRGRVEYVGCFVIEIFPDHMPAPTRSSSYKNAKSTSADRSSMPERRQPIVLSHREQEVLRLLAEGKTAKAIAATLLISVRTVETYKGRLMLKLQARSIAELVHYAIQNYIVKI